MFNSIVWTCLMINVVKKCLFRNKKCSCARQGRPCHSDFGCRCNSCDNPLNLFYQWGVDTQWITNQTCLMDNIFNIDVSSILTLIRPRIITLLIHRETCCKSAYSSVWRVRPAAFQSTWSRSSWAPKWTAPSVVPSSVIPGAKESSSPLIPKRCITAKPASRVFLHRISTVRYSSNCKVLK